MLRILPICQQYSKWTYYAVCMQYSSKKIIENWNGANSEIDISCPKILGIFWPLQNFTSTCFFSTSLSQNLNYNYDFKESNVTVFNNFIQMHTVRVRKILIFCHEKAYSFRNFYSSTFNFLPVNTHWTLQNCLRERTKSCNLLLSTKTKDIANVHYRQ